MPSNWPGCLISGAPPWAKASRAAPSGRTEATAAIAVAASCAVPTVWPPVAIDGRLEWREWDAQDGTKRQAVEIIADSVEAVMEAERLDGMVTFAGCDKSLPGIMMAMLRLNVPSVFMYGGSILPGRFKGHDVTVVVRPRPRTRRHAGGTHRTGAGEGLRPTRLLRRTVPPRR